MTQPVPPAPVWPLVCRTIDGRQWWVIAWWHDPAVSALAPVCVPRAVYGLAAASTEVVGPEGYRVTEYADPPAAPRAIDLRLIDGWIGPPLP